MWILLLLAVVGYTLILLLLWLGQDGMVFPGAGRWNRPVELAGVETVHLPGRDGTFRVAVAEPENPTAVLLFFVGNGEGLASAADRAAAFARAGIAVVSPEYPGYGGSAGSPGVAAFEAAAEAACLHARGLAQKHGLPLCVGGHSLGTFCAVHLAAAGKADRLLLLAPPTSMVDAAQAQFWWAPVSLLLRHCFDSLAVAGHVRCPVLVLHGEQDEVVPIALGKRLCAAFAGPTEFVRVPGCGHNDLPRATEGSFGERIAAFVRGR